MDVRDPRSRLSGFDTIATVFEASDVDDAGTTQYFGFLNANGNWIIQQYDTAASPKTLRYAGGQSNYSASWTLRASLTYGYYNAIFA